VPRQRIARVERQRLAVGTDRFGVVAQGGEGIAQTVHVLLAQLALS
jgi:hypothetical protein